MKFAVKFTLANDPNAYTLYSIQGETSFGTHEAAVAEIYSAYESAFRTRDMFYPKENVTGAWVVGVSSEGVAE